MKNITETILQKLQGFKIIKEACVETANQAFIASVNGADQIELCSDLQNDGLTPDLELVESTLSKISIPVKCMLRNKSGDFIYTKHDMEIMLNQLKKLKEYPIQGIVFGAMTKNGTLDLESIQLVAKNCEALPLTIHKCIDLVKDYPSSIEQLKKIRNVKYLLSSGQAPTAWEGKEVLLKMKKLASPEIELIAAGKIDKDNLTKHHDFISCSYYHGKKIVGDLH